LAKGLAVKLRSKPTSAAVIATSDTTGNVTVAGAKDFRGRTLVKMEPLIQAMPWDVTSPS
jgi:hypothetical protein